MSVIDLTDGFHVPPSGVGRFLVETRWPSPHGFCYRWTGLKYETLGEAERMCHELALATGGFFYVHEAGW